MTPAHEARKTKATEEYRAAMFDEEASEQKWHTSAMVERRAGKARSGSFDTLQRLVGDGLLERRPAGGGPYNRRKGWEYRWIREDESAL